MTLLGVELYVRGMLNEPEQAVSFKAVRQQITVNTPPSALNNIPTECFHKLDFHPHTSPHDLCVVYRAVVITE